MKPKRVTIQKEQKEKAQKFDLMAIDNNQLIHVNEWEVKLKKLVDENPFVEITDKESYNLAKSRKAILKNARLELRTTGKKESQESILLSKLKGITEFVKEKITFLVAIPTTPEELQQEEIDRYDLILEEQKNEADRLETIRTDAIKAEIERVKKVLQETVDGSSFATLVDDELAFLLFKVSGFDFQEFDFLFDEMIAEMSKKMEENVQLIKDTESQRIENLSKEIESKLNQMSLDSQNQIDNFEIINEQSNLIELIDEIFDESFDFWDYAKKHSEQKSIYIQKALDKIDQINENAVKEQRERIIEVREGLLDIVFDLTADKIDETTVYINESLDQEVLPELQAEFDKMKTRVMDSFEKKLASLADEVSKAEEREVKRMEKVMEARIKVITELGMVEVESEEIGTEWTGFGLTITDETLYQEDDIQTIIDEINEAKNDIELEAKAKEVLVERIKKIEAIGLVGDTGGNKWDGFGCEVNTLDLKMMTDEMFDEVIVCFENAKKADQAEIERQELIRKDKGIIVDRMIYLKNQINQYKPNTLENKESVDLWNELKKDLIWQIEDKIETINNF